MLEKSILKSNIWWNSIRFRAFFCASNSPFYLGVSLKITSDHRNLKTPPRFSIQIYGLSVQICSYHSTLTEILDPVNGLYFLNLPSSLFIHIPFIILPLNFIFYRLFTLVTYVISKMARKVQMSSARVARIVLAHVIWLGILLLNVRQSKPFCSGTCKYFYRD